MHGAAVHEEGQNDLAIISKGQGISVEFSLLFSVCSPGSPQATTCSNVLGSTGSQLKVDAGRI